MATKTTEKSENAEKFIKVKRTTHTRTKVQAADKGFKSMGAYVDSLVKKDA